MGSLPQSADTGEKDFSWHDLHLGCVESSLEILPFCFDVWGSLEQEKSQMVSLGYVCTVRWNASFLHSSVPEGAFVFVKMSLPNVLNVTMEIKGYLLTLIKHLPSYLLSWVNGQKRVSSCNFQRLRSREDSFDSKLKLSLGICSTARARGCRGSSAHSFALCSQPHTTAFTNLAIRADSWHCSSCYKTSFHHLLFLLPATTAQVWVSFLRYRHTILLLCHLIFHLYQRNICILIIWMLW